MKSIYQFKQQSWSLIKLVSVSIFVLFLSSNAFTQQNIPFANANFLKFTEHSSIFSENSFLKAADSVSVNVFAVGLNNPRGLKFGPDGRLYISEGGIGGTTSTAGQCMQVPAPVGPWLGGNSGRILRFNQAGVRSVVADGLPSAQNAIGDRMSVADVDFLDGRLYALLAAGGCSHGHTDIPAGILRINSNGTWRLIADISEFLRTHEVANPEPDDFEPDGTLYSMVAVRDDLYTVESNHGQLLRVKTNGNVRRVIDISASQGHVVPTALAYNGNFFVGNLTTFPLVLGAAKILKITPSGNFNVFANGFTAVLGVAFDDRRQMYVLETTTNNLFPTPGTGRVVRVNRNGTVEEIVAGLTFPTAMTFGPDKKLYISNQGFGPPIPGFGQILQVTVPRNDDDDDDDGFGN